MGSRAALMLWGAVVLWGCLYGSVSYGQPVGEPSVDCTNSLTELVGCLDFVTGANDTVDATCCTGLSVVKENDPVCLCQFISPSNANESESLGINVTRALELPGICNVDANAKQCDALGTPSEAPSVAPAPTAGGPVVAPSPPPATGSPPPATSPAAPAPPPPPVVVSPPPATPPKTSPSTPPTSAPTASPSSAPPAPAVSPGPPAIDCSKEYDQIASCISYVTGKAASPSATCCMNLKGVVKDAPSCLCDLATSSGNLSSIPNLDVNKAIQLPSLCSITDIDLTQCPGLSVPVPAAAPGPSSPGGSNPGAASKTVLSLFLSCVLAVSSIFLLLR